MKHSVKVNARITPKAERALKEIARATGSSMSAAIMRAIEAYYVTGAAYADTSPYTIAKTAGIIGCASGPGNLSTSYKEFIRKDLKKKHGHR